MNKRVLIVDDEEAIVAGLTMLFDLEHFESSSALDRLGAEELVDASYYPVLVSDLCLHSMEEGLALIDHVRQSSPDTRVVVLTAFATPSIVKDLRERGVDHVMQKPAASAEIVEAVLGLLQELEREAASKQLSLEELYLSARKKLIGISRGRFRLSPDAAEDVLQQAWMMFLEKREQVHAPAPWLAGTVANLSRQFLDRGRRKRETSGEDCGIEETMMVEEGDVDDVLAVRQALHRLDERSRKLCVLIGIEGLSYAEVSEMTGMPVGSIGPMFIRAKNKLRTELSH